MYGGGIPVAAIALLIGLSVVVNVGSIALTRRQGYRIGRRPPRLSPGYAFDPANSVRVRGGASVGWTSASAPLASLTMDPWWAAVTLVRTVWIDRRQTVAVRRINRMIGGGILFQAPDGRYDGVVFWTLDPDRVLQALAWYGWPVVGP